MVTSTSADIDGDVRVDFLEQRYTLVDTAFLARVPEMSVRNWQARGLFAVGSKHRLTGRWYFSLCDALRLAVMYDLCVRPGLDVGPRKASMIADIAVSAAMKAVHGPIDGRPVVNVLIAWDEAGELHWTTADTRHPGHYWPPPLSEHDDYEPLRRTIVCVPATSMLIDLGIRTAKLSQRNRRAEAPNHV